MSKKQKEDEKQKEEQRQKRLEVAYINIKHLQYLKALYERYDISENNYRLLDDEESEECLMIIDVDNEIWNRKLEKTRELVEKAQHRNKIAMELQEYLNQRLGDNLVIYNTWKHDDIFYTIIAERHKTTFLVNESIAMVSAEQYNKEDEEELEDEQRQTQRQ